MMSVLYRIVTYSLVVLPVTMHAQSFEKISIRRAASGHAHSFIRVMPNGDLTAHGVTVTALLSFAYEVPSNPSPRLKDLPGWAAREQYDIEAKAPQIVSGAGTEESERRRRVQQMVRGLLADRFKLDIDAKEEEMMIYALKASRDGLKAERSAITADECLFDTAPGGCHSFTIGFGHPLDGNAISMDDLAHYIENWTDFPVVNHTGIVGLYTMKTAGWQPMRLPPPPPGTTGAVNFDSLPTLSTVLRRLGLELQRQRETILVYRVARLEQPLVD